MNDFVMLPLPECISWGKHLETGKVRELMQYDVHEDAFIMRWDMKIGEKQVHYFDYYYGGERLSAEQIIVLKRPAAIAKLMELINA
jgi:hypothetical protein